MSHSPIEVLLKDLPATAFDPATPPIDPATNEPYPGRVSDGNGLYLKLWDRGGSHHWRFDYTRPNSGGKRNTMSFGTYPKVTLLQARAKAAEARAKLEAGIDPGAERIVQENIKKVLAAQREKETPVVIESGGERVQVIPESFEYFARDYHSGKTALNSLGLKEWSNSHQGKWIRALENHVFPYIGKIAIGEVTFDEVLKCMKRIEQRGHTNMLADVRQYTAQVFDYAVNLQKLKYNPMGRMDKVLRKHVGGNFPAVTKPQQLRAILVALEAYGGAPQIVAAIRIQMMLFQRPGNTIKMQWDDIDRNNWIWYIDGRERKIDETEKATAAPHVVVLPTHAIEILKDIHHLTGDSKYVFASPMRKDRTLSENTMNTALSYMGFDGLQTAHGFRATAMSIMQEYLGVPKAVIDSQMDHSNGDVLGTAYDRADWMAQRAGILEVWGDYLKRLRNGDPKCVEPHMMEAIKALRARQDVSSVIQSGELPPLKLVA